MPLTKAQAKKLHDATKDLDFVETSRTWDDAITRKPEWVQSIQGESPHDGLQTKLRDLRLESLNRKTKVVDFENEKVRVYPRSDKNIESDVDDIFARGLDSARAVTEILKYDKPSIEAMLGARDPALQDLTELLNKFQSNMKVHRDNEDQAEGMENARKELARFNGALVDLLVKRNVVGKKKEAIEAINFVRDFLWKKDISMPICVIDKKGMAQEDEVQVLRYAKPMEFGAAEFKRTDSETEEAINFWDGTQPWKQKLTTAVGGGKWFEQFLTENLQQLKKQSSTPMSRYTPNPANAFDCTDIIIDKDGNVSHLSSHERVAVTEPLGVGDTKSRQEVTDWNHLQLVTKARLESGLNSFMEKWGTIIGDDPIPYTILHQTLIGDEVTFSPDQSKAKASKMQASVIDSKTEANAAVRRMLENSTILRNKETGEIKFISNKFAEYDEISDDWQKVNIDLLETNNGINMWSARTRVRNNDYNDARQLIGNAVNMFAKVREKYPGANNDLTHVIDFLNSRDHSLVTPFKFRGEKVKNALKGLTNELRDDNGSFKGLPKDVRENIALSAQAAVELKCTVHETWLGSARRNIANFTRDYVRQVPILGHVIDWVVRGTMTVAAVGLKAVAGLITLPFSLPQWIKHRDDRREMYKSTYEGILAESLGSLRGGCMSSADRALEQAEQRVMMKKQFAQEGKIISYNDSPTEKARVYSEYGSTRTKHASAENATGTPGTSDDEVRGTFLNARSGVLSHVAETPEEQRLAKDLSSLRKGAYGKVTFAEYISNPAVGVKATKVAKVEAPPLRRTSSVVVDKKVSSEADKNGVAQPPSSREESFSNSL
ncbi:hypothetical protein OQJ13_08665 [Legionella sp. PATHC035]|uniref:hypothetical protein n=1 Tax=Legionella sp. PATHC035 TaxID=2992040 RepID=UPI00224472DF|nr:hypothetical protein [Legionella sp. PATHC035]MCW8409040.1 hypothetical protein [Legionella sp. PATHC035]